MNRRSRTLVRTSIAACGAALALAAPVSATTAHRDLDYDIDSPPAPSPAAQNQLDLYVPDGRPPKRGRPVVVYVHGGGWHVGDKANQITEKVALFTGAGYVFASVNYRLTPEPADPANPDPGRVMFPDHPHDVGEAIGWLDRHVDEYGGDPERIALIGHSAGAHLVALASTDPSYIEAYGVLPWQLIGTVSLDTDAFDIASEADPASPTANNPLLFQSAFGTPGENAATGSWAAASPLNWADPGDPEHLLVTGQRPGRVTDNRAMATALGQDPDGVLSMPYDHEGINDAVGGADDPAGETAAIMGFLERAVAAAKAPRVRLRDHPARILRTDRGRTRVRFAFRSKPRGAEFECSLDRRAFKPCRSPRSYRVDRGRHRFRVRALADGGRPGDETTWRFRIRRIG